MTPEMQRPASIFWANVQDLMIAVRHLDKALSMLPASAPRLDSDLSAKAVEIRHLLEHWWGARQNAGAWKGYRQKHGPGAEPTLMEFSPGEHGDLKIGSQCLRVAHRTTAPSRPGLARPAIVRLPGGSVATPQGGPPMRREP